MERLGHRPALDGLRGIAIAGVVAKHYWNWPIGGGFGVDLFFVLSGFLITTLLLEEHDRAGRIELRSFYIRRARRLLPALAVAIVVYLAVAITIAPERAASIVATVAARGLYAANIFAAYWPQLLGHGAFVPLWSLAEEEQFYLVWPLLLILLLRRAKMRTIERVLIAAIMFVIVERFVRVYGFHTSYRTIGWSPETRSDGLLSGALLALIVRRIDKPPIKARWAVALLALLAVLNPPLWFAGPVLDVGATGLIAVALFAPESRTGRVLACRPLVWLGLISYSLFLWHMLVLGAFRAPGRHAGWAGFAALVVSVAVAYASYRWVEQPFRRRRSRTSLQVAQAPAHA